MTKSSKPVYTGVTGRSEIFDIFDYTSTDIYAGDGNDVILGFNYLDLIFAGSGNDIVYGFADDDIIYGDNQSDGIQGSQIGSFTVDADALFGDSGNDVIFGQSGFDYINGDAGSDLIYGGLGDDFLQGSIGSDTIYGGDGNDIIYGNYSSNIPQSYARTINYTHNGVTDAASAGIGQVASGTQMQMIEVPTILTVVPVTIASTAKAAQTSCVAARATICWSVALGRTC